MGGKIQFSTIDAAGQWGYSERRHGKDLVLTANPLTCRIPKDVFKGIASALHLHSTTEYEPAAPFRTAIGGNFTA